MTAKILDVTPDEYHQLPGFSASLAKELIERSPLHAWQKHPLYGAKEKKPTKEMDFGQVGHTLVLGKGKRFAVLDVEDYKTKDARALRDAARKSGSVPIKRAEHDRALKMAEQVTAKLADRGLKLTGTSELAIEWTEESAFGPVLCRGMMDHVFDDQGVVIDLKLVGSASQASIERSAENFGYAIQEAAYRSALTKLKPELAGRIDFLFAFCETDEPYAVNLTRGDGMFRELGERRWRRAVETWAECVAANNWPGYGSGVNPLSAPAWAFSREEFAA